MSRALPPAATLAGLLLLLAGAGARAGVTCASAPPSGRTADPDSVLVRLDASPPDRIAPPFSVHVVAPGAEPAPGSRAGAVFAHGRGDSWWLLARGLPPRAGPADLVLEAGGAGAGRTLRFERAVTIPWRRMDAALLIDDSYSMRKTDPGRLRVEGARLFARIAAARGDVATLTIVAFSKRARVLLPPTPPSDSAAIDKALEGLEALGNTDMDHGFAMAHWAMAGLPESTKIGVVLSDGRDEPGAYQDGHLLFQGARWPVYTVGLSELADQATLRRIAASTGGRYFFAPTTEALVPLFRDIALAIHRSVTVAEWDAEAGGPPHAFPVDDSMDLVTVGLRGEPGELGLWLRPPDQAQQLLPGPRAGGAPVDFFTPARGPWEGVAYGAGRRTASVTARSRLDLVPFPPPDGPVGGAPVQLACALVHGHEAVTGALVTARWGGLEARLNDSGLEGDPVAHDGVYVGTLLPGLDGGTEVCRVAAAGRTAGGSEFQRLADLELAVAPGKRWEFGVRPASLRLEAYPGAARTGGFVASGEPGSTVNVTAVGFPAGLAVAPAPARVVLPASAAADLAVRAAVAAEVSPGTCRGEVLFACGDAVRTAALEVVVLPPAVTATPAALEAGVLLAGSSFTGRLALALSPEGAVGVRLGQTGELPLSGLPAAAELRAGRPLEWSAVLTIPADRASGPYAGSIRFDWGWSGTTVRVSATVTNPPPPPPPEPPPPPPEPEPVIEEPAAPPPAPPAEPVEPPAIEESPIVEEPPAAGEPPPAAPAPAAPVRWWSILLALLIALLLLAALWRLARAHLPRHRMLKYLLVSLGLHAVLLFLTMNVLIETRIVQLEDVAPGLAVTVRAVEESLGIEIMPPGPPVSLAERESAAEVARQAALSAEERDRAVSAAEVAAAEAEAPRERDDRMPGALEARTELAKPSAPEEAVPGEKTVVEAKRTEPAEALEAARKIVASAAAVAAAEARAAAAAQPALESARASRAEPLAVSLDSAAAIEPAAAVERRGAEQPDDVAREALAVQPKARAAARAEEPAERRADVERMVAQTAVEPAGAPALPSEPSGEAGSSALAPAPAPLAAPGPRSSAGTGAGERRSAPAAAEQAPGEGPVRLAVKLVESVASAAGPARVEVAAAASGGSAGGERLSASAGSGVEPAASEAAVPGAAASVAADAIRMPALVSARRETGIPIAPAAEALAGEDRKPAAPAPRAPAPPAPEAARLAVGRAGVADSPAAGSARQASAGAEREVGVSLPESGGPAASAPASVGGWAAPKAGGLVAAAPAAAARRVTGPAPELAPDEAGMAAPKSAQPAGRGTEAGDAARLGRAPRAEAAGGAPVERGTLAAPGVPGEGGAASAPALAAAGPRGGAAAEPVLAASGIKREAGEHVALPADAQGSVQPRGPAARPSSAAEAGPGGPVRVEVGRAGGTAGGGPGAAPAGSVAVPLAGEAAAAPMAMPAASAAPGVRMQALKSQLSFSIGGGAGGRASATLGLGRYGGDWDCSPTAMMFLSHQLRERTGMALEATDRIVPLDSPDLAGLPFVYITGHRDFVFSDAEIRNLRRYLEGGGYLWADDSTHFNDPAFDTAFRREIARVLPSAPLERLGADFPAFRTGYDLTRGYKGFAIPPGDKYRLDYIEGVQVGGRVAVVYTRNDYGDGLNIDPMTHPLKPSLTDLSPADMQEGATRMGVNMVLYFLTHAGQAEPEFLGRTSAALRRLPDRTSPAVPAGPARVIEGFAAPATWQPEAWSDGATASARGARLAVSFALGSNGKAALSLAAAPPLQLGPGDVVALDVESLLRCGCRIALGLTVGEAYYETAPFYLKPGENQAFFPMSASTFKTDSTQWEYRAPLPVPVAVDKLTVLIYSPAAGEVVAGNARVIRAPGR